MKKTEIKAIAEKIKRRRTYNLEIVREKLEEMIKDRKKTHNMYLWYSDPCYKVREETEKRYNVRYDIELYKDYSIYYVRHFSQSRAYTYASDWIWDSADRKITVSDLKKIISEIDIILDKRTKAKSAEQENMALAG